jgi:ribosomal protein S27AE
VSADHVPPHVDCPACPRCGRTVAISRHDDVTPLPSPSLRCPACGALWQASAADRAQAERADAANDVRLAAERVRRWLRGTVPGDLARVVGTGDGVATDDVAAVLDALDAAQRSAATERAQREAAEGECARLRSLLGDVYALATGDVDGVPSDPVLAMNRSIGAIAKLHHRANDLTEQRDAAVARCTALAGAVRAAVEHERAVTQRERDEIGARWFGDLADVPVVAEARAALDALLTEEEVGDGR